MSQRFTLRLYQPHEKQLAMHQCRTRFLVGAWGRQSGKSTGALNQMLRAAWENPNTRYWFVSPTFPQARVMYRRLVGMLWRSRDIMVKKNQTELRVKLINNSEVRFVSGEVLDNLRGETLHGGIIDEVRDQHPDLWPMVIRPMLATTRGWCWFISTPNGFDHFYDLAQTAKTDPDWSFLSAPSTANPLFSNDEFEAAKRNMSEAQFAQEILAEFRNLKSGRVYYAFGEHNLSNECPFSAGRIYSPHHPVLLGPDFNVNPMGWSLGQYGFDMFWWFDEIHLENSNTIEAAKEFRDKILIMKEAGFRPDPNVIICGDASGKNRSTKSNQSDYDIIKAVLKEAGITYSDRTPEANPSVKDRVNAVNTSMMSAAGEVHWFCHRQYTPWLQRDMERVLWKTGSDFTLDPGKDRQLTHHSDGAGYPVAELAPVKPVKTKSKLTVLHRTL